MWEAAGKIIEYGIIGVLVVASVGILIFSLKHVNKILSKIDTVHEFYNNIVAKQNSDQKVEIKELHKEHKSEIKALNKTNIANIENTTSHFIGTLKTIHDDNLTKHRETIDGQKKIEKMISDNNQLFGSFGNEKHPH